MNTPESQLNIVFHGLWAFETTKEGPIIAYTPYVEHHTFKAGTLKNNVDLVRSAQHVLQSVPSQTMPHSDFTLEENVYVSGAFDDKKGDLFCKVKLDRPDEIRSVRLVDVKAAISEAAKKPRKKDDPPFIPKAFLGKDGEQLNPAYVAMVQVVIYDDVKTPETVSLEPAGAKPTQSDTGPWNLHIFAQPNLPGEGSPHHYEVMARMFGLEIMPNPEVEIFAAASNPHITGLTKNDVLGLDEIYQEVSGSNCDGLLIINRELEGTLSK
jgi:hypothetical protein